MNVLAENEGKTYAVLAIGAPEDFVNLFHGALFSCMIWDHDGRFTEAQRSEVAKRLLQAGCRYAVCGGHNCESWHDAVDEVFVRQHVDDPDETRVAEHVMTSWHADEIPDDVAFFFMLNTNFDDHDFKRYLVLHVGDGKTKGEVDAAVLRHVLNR